MYQKACEKTIIDVKALCEGIVTMNSTAEYLPCLTDESRGKAHAQRLNLVPHLRRLGLYLQTTSC